MSTSDYRDTTVIVGMEASDSAPEAALVVSQNNKDFTSVPVPGKLVALTDVSHVNGTRRDLYIGQKMDEQGITTPLGLFDEKADTAAALTSKSHLPYFRIILFSQLRPDGKQVETISMADRPINARQLRRTLEKTVLTPETHTIESSAPLDGTITDNVSQADVKVTDRETDIAYTTARDVIFKVLSKPSLTVRRSLSSLKKDVHGLLAVSDISQTPTKIVLAGTVDHEQELVVLNKKNFQVQDVERIGTNSDFPSTPSFMHRSEEQTTVYGKTTRSGLFAFDLRKAYFRLLWLNKRMPQG